MLRFQFNVAFYQLDSKPRVMSRITEQVIVVPHEILVRTIRSSLGLLKIFSFSCNPVESKAGSNHCTAVVCPLGLVDDTVCTLAVPVNIVHRITEILIEPAIEFLGHVQNLFLFRLRAEFIITEQKPSRKSVGAGRFV